jgi:serine phosphatase RsbU (regulator of sigma subunit)
LAEKHAGESAQRVVDALFKAADEYSAGADAFDDQTVVVIKVKDGAASGASKRK